MGERLNFIRDNLRAILKPDLSQAIEPFSHYDEVTAQMARIYGLMYPHIQRAEYSLIVSDADSGTIPAFVFKSLIDSEYKKIEKEETSLVLVDLGDDHAWNLPGPVIETIAEYVGRSMLTRPSAKALIVTEHMGYGKHAQDIAKVVSDLGMDYDVATLTLRATPEAYKNRGQFPLRKSSQLFYAEFADRNPLSDLSEGEREVGLRNVGKIASAVLSLYSLQKRVA